MADNTSPPGNPSHLTFIGTRLNPGEMQAFLQLQKDLKHEGHGAQSATLKEVLRDRLKQYGYLGPQQK